MSGNTIFLHVIAQKL